MEDSVKNTAASQMFASFRLGKSELAIAIHSLQEVVRVPEKISLVPLAPAYLTGLFNLRGVVTPIVDMSKLLGLESGATTDDKRIAILCSGQVRIGLMFDSTSEILTVPNDSINTFGDEVKGGKITKRSLIRSVLKLENGERLIEVIDPLSLLKIENLPQILEQTKNQVVENAKRKTKRGQVITFRSGALEFGLRIAGISEIIRVPDIKESVLSVDACLGMITLRGSIIPILDFQQFLKIDGGPEVDQEKRRIVILKLDKVQVGFLVDSVDSIVTYFEEDILPIPMFQQEKADMMRGMLPQPQGEGIVVLHEDKILSHGEILDITRGHEHLYGDKNNLKNEMKAKAASRKPYIAFRLDKMLSARLSSIDEIANASDDLMRPPGYPQYVLGLMKMRGEVITVIDLRSYYGMPTNPTPHEPKVLIIRGEKAKFGLLVDGVESITTVDETQKIKLPSVLLQDMGVSLKGDMQEVVEMADTSGNKKTYMILDMPEVLRKLEQGMGLSA